MSRFVSVEGARQRYGVVIDPATLEVNVSETKRLCASIRSGGQSPRFTA